MGKIDSSYPTLLGGVSQAPFARRNYARHEEQVNMMPDPVLGLVRRPGSVLRDSVQASAADQTLNFYSSRDTDQFVGWEFQSGGNEYTYFMRKGAKDANSQIIAPGFLVNRSTNALVPVTINPSDTAAALLVSGGVASGAAVGAMLVMAGNTITPAYSTEYPWAIEDNQKRAVVWVRGGAYSRRYRIAMVRGNQKLWVEYTTLAPSYPVALDTTDLDPTASDYLKKVNDRTNLYNTAATKWINDALADIAPENIASQLAQTIRESGFLSAAGTVQVVGSSVCITDPALEDVESDDGGDGPLMRAAGNVVGAAELLTTLGYPGKVVQVRPGNSPDSQVFYLKARAKDRSSGAFTPVTWEECAGVEFTPTSAFVFLAVNAAGDAAYLSSDVAYINSNAGTNFPTYQASASGDATSNPPPEFFGKKVTNVAVFQDRLIVSKENGYVSTSRPGDYLNFFRASALTVVDDDPVSFAIIGGESDTVRHSLMYDRNLVLVGGKKQYLINGKSKLAPGTASATVMASIPGTTGSAPVLVEDRLFYTKGHNGYGSIHWFEPGKIAESPVTHEATQEVTTYIEGTPFDMVATLTPDMVIVRSPPSSLGGHALLYMYSYGMGQGQQRIDAIHKWQFDYQLGPIMGISSYDGVLQMLTLRQVGTVLKAVLDTIELQPDGNLLPYLDSQSPTNTLGAPYAASGAGTYSGGLAAAAAPGMQFGWYMESYVTLTSPSVMTGAGEPTREGNTIVSSLLLHLKNASGLAFQATSNGNSVGGYLSGDHAYDIPTYNDVNCPCPPGYDGGIVLHTQLNPTAFRAAMIADATTRSGNTIIDWVPGGLESGGTEYFDHDFVMNNAWYRDPGIGDVTGKAGARTLNQISTNDDACFEFTINAPGRVGVGVFNEITGWDSNDPEPYVTYFSSIWNSDGTLSNGGPLEAYAIGDVIGWVCTNTSSLVYKNGVYVGEVPFYAGAGKPYAAFYDAPFGPVAGADCPDVSFVDCEDAEGLESLTENNALNMYFEQPRIMSMSDVGTPSPTDPVTNAVPYKEVKLSLPIGRRNLDYRATLSAYHWGPLEITAIDWTGQFHYRTRRV